MSSSPPLQLSFADILRNHEGAMRAGKNLISFPRVSSSGRSMSSGLFEPCDLDALIAPPAKRQRRKSAFASLPGLKPAILDDFDLLQRLRQDM